MTVYGTTASYVPKPLKCSVCGRDSLRNNVAVDFDKRITYEMCSHCRQPLKEGK